MGNSTHRFLVRSSMGNMGANACMGHPQNEKAEDMAVNKQGQTSQRCARVSKPWALSHLVGVLMANQGVVLE